MINEVLLKKLVRIEVESYRLLKPSTPILLILLVTLTLSIVTCLFVLVSMFQPLVFLKGEVLNGVVGLISYRINILGSSVHLPPLESLRLIAFLLLIKNVVVLAINSMSIYGLFVRLRSWIILVPISSSSSALLISITFSLLRVYTIEVVPALAHSVSVTNLHGVFILERPKIEYTWLSNLPHRPIYFLIFFSILFALTLISLIIFLYTPHPLISVKKGRMLRKLKGRIGVKDAV